VVLASKLPEVRLGFVMLESDNVGVSLRKGRWDWEKSESEPQKVRGQMWRGCILIWIVG